MLRVAICVAFLAFVTAAISADAPTPTNGDLRVFIEQTRKSIRAFSRRCTPSQRKALKAHAEFFADEVVE